MRILFTLLLLIPTFATAQDFSIQFRADMNGDDFPDRAELVQDFEENTFSLNIFLGKLGGGEDLVVNAIALGWIGGAAGQQPIFNMTSHGSLQVTSMNESIGRSRWHETLTIAYRDNIFKIAGYTYDWYDTLDVSINGSCDINLLNGRGEMMLGEYNEKSSFRTDLRAMPVNQWIRKIPKVCLSWIE